MIICAVYHASQGFLEFVTMEVYHHSHSVEDAIRDAGGMGLKAPTASFTMSGDKPARDRSHH